VLEWGVVTGRLCRIVAVGVVGVPAFAAFWSCAPTDWGTDDRASCTDERRNGTETDVDCGGTECKSCVIGNACLTSSDCASGECSEGTCQELHCTNLVKDQDEQGVDCGGTDCRACAGSDPCTNHRKDENETDIDCGGLSACARCQAGDSCASDGDCLTSRCTRSVCQADGTGTGGASPEGGSAGEAGQYAVDTGGAGGQGGAPSLSAGSGAFAGASGAGGGAGPAAGGTAEAGGSESPGGAGSASGASAGAGGAGAPSAGGSESPGGASGAGGATAGAGGVGGGTGGNRACSHTPISGDGLITDFSEFAPDASWTSGALPWGDADLSGTTRHYGTSTVTLTASVTSGENLNLAATLPRYRFTGLALDFDTCSDASDYAGIAVTLQGSVGVGQFYLQLETRRNMPNDDPDGHCVYTSEASKWEDCGYNYVAITDLTDTAKVYEFPWSQFTGGKPITPVDATELLGMQFQFECTTSSSCPIDVTLTDVRWLAP
jgi:hypothetical protein